MSAPVSRSTSPPRALVRAARGARLTAALGLAALSVFLLVDVGLAPASAGPDLEASALPRRSALPPPGEGTTDVDQESAAPTSSGIPLPPLSPRQILVDVGPPRSEVFVEGHRVGQTPFLGQVRCRPGREISIHIVPERGLPLTEKRVCPP